jgi:predicted Zn-dependent protease
MLTFIQNLSADNSQDVTEKFSSPFKIEEEYFLGKAVAVNLISKYGLSTDKKSTEYVSAIGNTIALASDQPSTFHGYTFGILNTDKIFSFACPDGFIFLSKGLIKTLDNEDQLAAVLANEIAHIVYNDPVFSVSRETVVKYNNLIKTSMNSDSNFGEEIKIMFGKITEEILMNLEKGYDSEINIRADNQALTSLVNSNYSTSEYNAYLEKLYKNEDYAITHPDQEKRLANLKNKIPKSSAGLAMKNRTKRFTDIFAIK